MRFTPAVGLIAIGLLPMPAAATETVSCEGVGGSEVTVEMNVGEGLPATLPNWVRVRAVGREWSTLDLDEGMTPVNLYQAFDDGRMLSIDLADEPVSDIVLSLRILRAEEGDSILRVGYLQVHGLSVHPILCDFGDSE